MKRKILSVFFALALIVSMISVVSFAVEWETPKLSIEASYNNEQVKASIKIGPHTDLAALNFTLNYDSSKLSISGTPSGMDFFASAIVGTTSAGKITPTWQNINGTSSETEKEIFSVTFDVISGQSGDVQFTIENVSMTDKSGDNEVMEAGTGSILSAKVTIPAPTVAVTGISLNKTTLALTEGNSETLIATITPDNATDKTVTWSSSKEGVATVDANGKVTAVAVGDAIITAKAGDKTATCTVTVSAAPCTHPNKTEHDAVLSTCKVQGTAAYWECDACHKLFDAEGNVIDAPQNLPIDSTNHVNKNNVEAVASTCKTAGHAAYTKCADCNVIVTGSDVALPLNPNNHESQKGVEWEKDSIGHWHVWSCCNAKADEDTHTPDHEGGATENYPIKCSKCGYIIEAQLEHTHGYNQQVATEEHRASTATCQHKATYYFSCTCGANGTETFESGDLASHTPSNEWSKDDQNHWKQCSVCQTVITDSRSAHEFTPNHDANKHWEECECGMKQNEAAHEFLPDSDKCTDCGYTKSSSITIITRPDNDTTDTKENPSTGAVSSPVGYVVIGLAAVGALCLGAKKLTKKHED